MTFSANLVGPIHNYLLELLNFFSPICHLHMPNLHIQTVKHVYANELYIWQTQRKSNTHIVVIFGMLINNTTVIRMTLNWKAAGIL